MNFFVFHFLEHQATSQQGPVRLVTFLEHHLRIYPEIIVFTTNGPLELIFVVNMLNPNEKTEEQA